MTSTLRNVNLGVRRLSLLPAATCEGQPAQAKHGMENADPVPPNDRLVVHSPVLRTTSLVSHAAECANPPLMAQACLAIFRRPRNVHLGQQELPHSRTQYFHVASSNEEPKPSGLFVLAVKNCEVVAQKGHAQYEDFSKLRLLRARPFEQCPHAWQIVRSPCPPS